jgi:N-acyl-L-homoserine lactone synthetase
MKVDKGTQQQLPEGLYSSVIGYRHKVFVEHLGWELKTFGNTEQDQFDHEDTIYLVTRDDFGNVSGCARLLPTTKPYLLGDVFPQLFNGMPVPKSELVWELSRFAAVDFNARNTPEAGQFSSPITLTLLKEVMAYAAELGAKRLVTVSPVGVERLLKKAGVHAHRAGPPMIIDGHPIFACWIELEG